MSLYERVCVCVCVCVSVSVSVCECVCVKCECECESESESKPHDVQPRGDGHQSQFPIASFLSTSAPPPP